MLIPTCPIKCQHMAASFCKDSQITEINPFLFSLRIIEFLLENNIMLSPMYQWIQEFMFLCSLLIDYTYILNSFWPAHGGWHICDLQTETDPITFIKHYFCESITLAKSTMSVSLPYVNFLWHAYGWVV